MDLPALNWNDAPFAALACVALKMLYDVVYTTIPKGFESIREAIGSIETSASERHNEHMAAQERLFRKLLKQQKKCLRSRDFHSQQGRTPARRRRRGKQKGRDPP